jgi:hypothetical protein
MEIGRYSMPDETNSMKESLNDVWEVLSDLEETVNDLVLQLSATQMALAKTLPNFAREYDQTYSDARSEQEKRENEEVPNVRGEFRRLRERRKGPDAG